MEHTDIVTFRRIAEIKELHAARYFNEMLHAELELEKAKGKEHVDYKTAEANLKSANLEYSHMVWMQQENSTKAASRLSELCLYINIQTMKIREYEDKLVEIEKELQKAKDSRDDASFEICIENKEEILKKLVEHRIKLEKLNYDYKVGEKEFIAANDVENEN